MPDFDPAESFFPSESLPESDDQPFHVPSAPTEELPPVVREGLPPDYRMRHDSHYVEQLGSKAAGAPVRFLPIKDIDRPQRLDVGDLGPLVTSILELGMIQPVLVRRRNGRYELIAGAKRIAAALAAGLTEVPCFLHRADDARARSLAEADNLGGFEASRQPPEGVASSTTPLGAFAELSRSLSTILSSLHPSPGWGQPLQRLMFDLTRAEVQRAAWLVQGLNILAEDPVIVRKEVRTSVLVDEVLSVFAPQRRLLGVDLSVENDNPPATLRADDHLMALAVGGAVGAVFALLQEQDAEGSCLRLRLTAAASRPSTLILNIAQDAVVVPRSALARFFDQTWVDRPGGYAAAVGLSAARRVAELHQGQLNVAWCEAGGYRLTLVIPNVG